MQSNSKLFPVKLRNSYIWVLSLIHSELDRCRNSKHHHHLRKTAPCIFYISWIWNQIHLVQQGFFVCVMIYELHYKSNLLLKTEYSNWYCIYGRIDRSTENHRLGLIQQNHLSWQKPMHTLTEEGLTREFLFELKRCRAFLWVRFVISTSLWTSGETSTLTSLAQSLWSSCFRRYSRPWVQSSCFSVSFRSWDFNCH